MSTEQSTARVLPGRLEPSTSLTPETETETELPHDSGDRLRALFLRTALLFYFSFFLALFL